MIQKNHHIDSTKTAISGKDFALFLICLWWWSSSVGEQRVACGLSTLVNVGGLSVNKWEGHECHGYRKLLALPIPAVDSPLPASYFIPRGPLKIPKTHSYFVCAYTSPRTQCIFKFIDNLTFDLFTSTWESNKSS